MIIKAVIVAMLFFIVYSLGAALVYLVKDNGATDRTARALTVRVALSVVLFVLLMIAFATGLITPTDTLRSGY
jgi:apolipoprotein N-acyltransferase